MRRALLLAVVLGCAPAAAPRRTITAGSAQRTVLRRLPPPPVIDLDAPDAPYRAALALQLQPGWAQFLEDCRLRLGASHPLNVMTLAGTADIAIDARGLITSVEVATSGNPDFDRAIRQVIADATPLPRPPAALWGDDDRVHVRWLFARDRRQAGPATAAVVAHALPVRDVTARLIAAGDLTRAARRIQREPVGAERDAAITELMVAGLRDALTSSDATVRRAAVEAIGTAKLVAFVPETRELVASADGPELRITAVETLARLGDRSVVPALLEGLRRDIKSERTLALAEAAAAIDLGAPALVAEIVVAALPDAIALHVLGLVERPAVDAKLATWQRSRDARVRAGVCAGAVRARPATAAAVLRRGLQDRDAAVRAACLVALGARGATTGSPLLGRVTTLMRDRDGRVRAAAIVTHGLLSNRDTLPDFTSDRVAEVRVAYARAVARFGNAARMIALLDDRDPDVRATAWELAQPAQDLEPLLLRALKDPAPQVRRAIIRLVTDATVLTALATGDDDAEVRTRARVALTLQAGRAASTEVLVERFATGGSAERVRAALAWHLAR